MAKDKADKVVHASDEYKDQGADYGIDLSLLEDAFAEATKIYKERGFMRKAGYGKAPAITTVDMAKAWMSDGHPFTCENNEEICANALKVLNAGRESGVPIFHSTTGYWGEEQWDLPRWDEYIPMHSLEIDSEWMEIDPKLDPQPEEPVIDKKFASNFFGTHLDHILTKLGVDTLIVMGATACACVRHTVMDSTGYGYKTIVPRGTIGDRVPGVTEWNLFDMDAKFADVVSVEEVVEYLEGIDDSVYNHRPGER